MHGVVAKVDMLAKTVLSPEFHSLIAVLVGKDVDDVGLLGLLGLLLCLASGQCQ